MDTQIQLKEGAWDRTIYWLRRAGGIGFFFFLLKGLAWIIIPVAIATGSESLSRQTNLMQQGQPAEVVVKAYHEWIGKHFDDTPVTNGDGAAEPVEGQVGFTAKSVYLAQLVAHVVREALGDLTDRSITVGKLLSAPVRHGEALEPPAGVMFALEAGHGRRGIAAQQGR